jgi:hypothetical protein
MQGSERGWAVLIHFSRAYDIFVTGQAGADMPIAGVKHILVPFNSEASARIGMSDLITTLVPLLGGIVKGEVVPTDALDQQQRDGALEALPQTVVSEVLPWDAGGRRAIDRGQPDRDEGPRGS